MAVKLFAVMSHVNDDHRQHHVLRQGDAATLCGQPVSEKGRAEQIYLPYAQRQFEFAARHLDLYCGRCNRQAFELAGRAD
jgi:hypothetical protein